MHFYVLLCPWEAFCMHFYLCRRLWKALENIVDCMFVCIFTVFALYLLVLEDLGMHSGLHVCINIYSVCAVFACPGRPLNA